MENAIYAEPQNGRALLTLVGRIDSSNATATGEKIDELLAGFDHKGVTIDADKLEYTSSAGLRVLLKIVKTEKDVEMINVSSDVYDVLEMTGFTELLRVSKAYRRIDITNCEAIAQGANGKVYRLDDETIIKVYINPDSLPDIQRERELARCAFVHGIPTAISYDVVKVDDGYGSVFEMLNAQSIAKKLIANPAEIDECVDFYVDLLKQIHETHIEEGKMPDMKSVAVDWAVFMKDYLPAEVGEKLVALVEAVPKQDTMIHGDYHIRNVMIQKGEPLLIDMDTLSLGHPIFELASMFLAYKGFSICDKTAVEKFLGIPYETSCAFWRKSIKKYLGTEDEAVIDDVENKASVIGLTRLARRTIRRNGLNTPDGKAIIDASIARLTELVATLDTLTF